MTEDDPDVLAEMRAAFDAYEAALMADDLARLDAAFHAAPSTIRYGVGEVLYGIEAIRAFRSGRGGSPARRLCRVELHSFGQDFAIAHAEFFRTGSAVRGRQLQSWVRFADGWKIVAAHVSLEGRES